MSFTILVFMSTSTHHAHPPLGRYARSRVWAPLFRNSGSAPAYLGMLKKVNKLNKQTGDCLVAMCRKQIPLVFYQL